MKQISERLKHLIDTSGFTPNSFATSIGVSSTVIYNILSDRNKPSVDFINALHEKLDINPNWLLLGIPPIKLNDGETISKIKSSNKSDNTESELLESESEFHAKHIKSIVENPNYREANNIRFKISEHNAELKEMIRSFNHLLSNMRLLLQFISQYDFIINTPIPHIEIMRLLNQKGKKGVEQQFDNIFFNLPKMLEVINKLNASTSRQIENLRPFDFENKIDESYYENIREIERKREKLDFENNQNESILLLNEILDLYLVYDISLKKYPEIE